MKTYKTNYIVALLGLAVLTLSLSNVALAQCEVSGGPDLSICAGESIQIGGSPTIVDAGANPVLSWNNGAGNVANPMVSPNTTTTYTVSLTDDEGCNTSAEITVVVSAPGDAALVADEDISRCSNQSAYALDGDGVWSGFGVSNNVFSGNVVGIYTLTYTQGQGACLSSADINLQVHDIPTSQAPSDIEICAGETITLTGSGTSTNSNVAYYSWSQQGVGSVGFGTSIEVSPTNTSTFNLTVADDNQCSSADAVTVIVNGLPNVDAGADASFCQDNSQVALAGVPTGGTWSGSNVTSTGAFTPSATGTFNLTYSYTDSDNCTNTDELEVEVISQPTVDAGDDLSLCVDASAITLSPDDAPSGAVWTGASVDPSGHFDPAASGVGSHTVTLSFGSGSCNVSDTRIVEVHSLPVLNVLPEQVACQHSGDLQLQFAPAGGEWSGAGFIDTTQGTFDTASNTGNYSVSYAYNDPVTGCSNTAAAAVLVRALPQVEVDIEAVACANVAIPINNTSDNALSFVWSHSEGGNSNDFEPDFNLNFDGLVTVSCVAEDVFGCTQSFTEEINLVAPPTVDFTLSAVQGCAPLEVDATSTTSGQFLDFSWTVDGSTFATEDLDPTVLSGGLGVEEYDVVLEVSNLCGTVNRTETVSVLPLPQAAFSTEMMEFCSPWHIDFANTSETATSFVWDFGDGSTSSQQTPGTQILTTENDPSIYTVQLTAQNDCGTDVFSQDLTVLPNTISADFSLSALEGCVPFDVSIQNTSSGGNHYTYDFGNATMLEEESPSYLYDMPGVYNITQVVDDGCSFDTTIVNVEVFPAPVFDFGVDNNGVCLDTPFQFENNSETLAQLTWEFGDTNTSNSVAPAHNFDTAGPYTVVVDAETAANGCVGQFMIDVEVFENPTADFSASSEIGCAPFEVDFTNNSTGGNLFEWTFSDGQSEDNSAPSVTFENGTNAQQTIVADLIVTSANNCSSTASIDIEVSPSPTAQFSLSSDASCVFPVTESVNNDSQGATMYNWSINNVAVSEDASPDLLFEAIGIYTIELQTENAFGCIAASSAQFEVNEAPTASFAMSSSAGCAPFTAITANNSTGGMAYNWEIAGQHFTALNPELSVETPGEYSASLLVTNAAGCTDEFELPVAFTVHEVPVADFSYNVDGVYEPTVQFQNTSGTGSQFNWQFGDGNVSQLENPAHQYTDGGNYDVFLTVSTDYGCSNVFRQTVEVQQDYNVFVPTAFSPNSDGLNDSFKPVLAGGGVDLYNFLVFDQWGDVIFETKNPEKGWIGNSKGGTHYVPDGIYNWRLEVAFSSDPYIQVYRGGVTVVR